MSNSTSKEPVIGLSSMDALNLLSSEILQELDNCHCRSHGWSGIKFWISDSFSYSSMSSTFRWPSIFVGLVCATFFVSSYCETKDISHLIQLILVLTVLVFNVALIGYDIRKYHMELHHKARVLANRIREMLLLSSSTTCFTDHQAWTSGRFFPNLYLPHSPCISLQPVFRDGIVVNLPTVLLVAGDVIKLSPAAPAPAKCKKYATSEKETDDGKQDEDDEEILSANELFMPVMDAPGAEFTGARLRRSVQPENFLMLETPYLSNLRNCFHKSWNRPRSSFDKERHDIVANYIECIFIPLSVILLLIVSGTHYSHFAEDGSLGVDEVNSIFLRLTLVIFPIVPFALPVSWVILNAFGNSRLRNLCPHRDERSNLMDAGIGRLERQGRDMDDIDTEMGSDINDIVINYSSKSWKEEAADVIRLLVNRDGELWRSANLLQALGSLTALCCIDKKGILSWPNPTADKVFFLTQPSAHAASKKHSVISDSMASPAVSVDERSDEGATSDGGGGNINSPDDPPTTATAEGKEDNSERVQKQRTKRSRSRSYQSKTHVLDVTHDPHSAFSMQFDDPTWDRFMPNLKPLGLAVLLNTCNPDAHEEYTLFCDHIACESLHNEIAVPVVNKRCLCELSRQIGFTDSAVKDYDYMYQLAMFRHVRHEVIQHGKLLTTLNIPSLKMPFPHIASALIKEKMTNTYQLFSQGTGDLILDCCSEYWDGSDLRCLTETDRKRILDFYHRSSLTAYCMAFSYVPLTTIPDINQISGYYLELAPDSSHLFNMSEPTGNRRTLLDVAGDGRTSSTSRLSGRYLSNESLVMKDAHQAHASASPLTSPAKETADPESIANQMSNEVFIGMTAMQYQACPDFVQLVEQLEKACIRFVHFSKENELRSRVFSEKMGMFWNLFVSSGICSHVSMFQTGMEAGWNCHISLKSDELEDELCLQREQSEKDHAKSHGSKISLTANNSEAHPINRSQSAPCAVNLDSTVVKFSEAADVVVRIDSTPSPSSSEESSDDETDPLTSSPSKKDKASDRRSSNISPSPSRITDSTGTEAGTVAANAHVPTFDVLNRAKLPKGIDQIRPHIENVDNVPLLVSLFTDCSPTTTYQMISIMQEYGEVVCVLGSGYNMDNMDTFLIADVSIGVEPLFPEACVAQAVMQGDEEIVSNLSPKFISPMNLAQQLITLPCSLTLHREDPICLYRLIMEARNIMAGVRNSLQFLLCCTMSLALVQLLASLLFLPPLLSSGQVLWLVFFVLPILSFSLMGVPLDPEVMRMASGKNLNLDRRSVVYFLFCYLIKFAPSMLLVIGIFIWSLVNFNDQKEQDSNSWSFLDVR